MNQWLKGDSVIVRYIARSDGSVAMALPTIVIQDNAEVLALYVPADAIAKDNYIVPPAQRVAAVGNMLPSRERRHIDRSWSTSSIRLYLPDQAFSVWLFFSEQGEFISWYGNLEAPFVRTRFGIDTRDHSLDVLAFPDGRWRWKDEEEFARRLALGIDSANHQATVWAAGREFISRFEHRAAPFNQGWEKWRAPAGWIAPVLPTDWDSDFGTHAALP